MMGLFPYFFPPFIMETATLPEQATESSEASHNTLEDRTLRFAANVRLFVAKLPRAMIASDDVRQLLRASGSIGSNYIEAHESLNKREFITRMRICLKETKESHFWLNLLDVKKSHRLQQEQMELIEEVVILIKIFSASLRTIRRKAKARREAEEA